MCTSGVSYYIVVLVYFLVHSLINYPDICTYNKWHILISVVKIKKESIKQKKEHLLHILYKVICNVIRDLYRGADICILILLIFKF